MTLLDSTGYNGNAQDADPFSIVDSPDFARTAAYPYPAMSTRIARTSPSFERIFPFNIGRDETAHDVNDLAAIIMNATDRQLSAEGEPVADSEEFQLSSDALNLWRVLWRCREEKAIADDVILRECLAVRICLCRGYDEEEFNLAMDATQHRPRLPYGWLPLEVAAHRAKRSPIQLLHPDLREGAILTAVAALAIHLQKLGPRPYVLLPVENLRELLGCRKIAISGAIRKLMNYGLIEQYGDKYHTGRAREFICKAEEGRDFVYK